MTLRVHQLVVMLAITLVGAVLKAAEAPPRRMNVLFIIPTI